MQLIRSKDLYMLLRETLKLFDRRPIVHGGKVAYIVYKMLQLKGGLEDYELADTIFLTNFHDIGAYRTEDMEEMIKYETKSFRAHCLYGQLFLENLSLTGEMAKIILYHHDDYGSLQKPGFSFAELTSYISLAEAIDIFSTSLGEKFRIDIFEKKMGGRFSKTAFELFKRSNDEYDLFGQIRSRAYISEMADFMENFILTNAEKEKLIELLMFTLALKSDTVIKIQALCVALCEKLGILLRLPPAQQTNLIHAAYLHDIGLLAFRKEWIEDMGKLSSEQMEKLAYHTLLMEKLLKDRVRREVINIAAAHHERVDGKGYPRRLTENQMNLAQLILQFADTLAVLMAKPKEKEVILAKIKDGVDSGALCSTVAKIYMDRYGEIAEYAHNRQNEILGAYRRLEEQYTGNSATV